MTREQLCKDLERYREKLHYAQFDAERIVEAIFREAKYWEKRLSSGSIADKEIEDYLEQDSVVKQ